MKNIIHELNKSFIFYFFILLIFISNLFFYTITSAVDYSVTASVPYEVPNSKANILSPLNNSTSTGSNIALQGNCQQVPPYSIISIWNKGVFSGSTTCQSGSFNVNIQLNNGENILIAKTSNISNSYGPDSDPVSVTFSPPPSQNIISNPIQNNQNRNNGNETQTNNLSPLVKFETPFGVLNDKGFVSFKITILRGNQPFKININWGDGSTLSKEVTELGDYVFEYTYTTLGEYKVNIIITDVLGISSNYTWQVVSSLSETSDTDVVQQINGNLTQTNAKIPMEVYFFSILLLLIFLILSFYLGRYYQTKVLMKKNEKTDK